VNGGHVEVADLAMGVATNVIGKEKNTLHDVVTVTFSLRLLRSSFDGLSNLNKLADCAAESGLAALVRPLPVLFCGR